MEKEIKYYSTLGKNIEMLLLLTQTTKAELAEMVGVSRATVTGWVYNTKEPRGKHVNKLCEVFTELINPLVPMRIKADFLCYDDLQHKMCNYLKRYAYNNNLWLAKPYTYEDVDREIMGDDSDEAR